MLRPARLAVLFGLGAMLHVPAWLPALYLHVSLMTRAAYLVLIHRAARS